MGKSHKGIVYMSIGGVNADEQEDKVTKHKYETSLREFSEAPSWRRQSRLNGGLDRGSSFPEAVQGHLPIQL